MLDVSEIKVDGYECVVRGIDRDAGYHGLIAVHSTTLGPALGGLRMWTYANEREALDDVIRLAKGMTYKSAVARTGLGGGKAVIIGDSRTDKTPALLHAVGGLINYLDGRYLTAEDVGISEEDLDCVAEVSRWVSGRHVEDGGSGNPSPYTARGTLVGLNACLEEVFGSAEYQGKRFAVQGIGAVSRPLCEWIVERGGKIIAADVNPDHLEWARQNVDAETVDPSAIYAVECDAFLPCALGASINDDTVPRLKTQIVAGCANNQLQSPSHARALHERGILYAPDYVINAGGIINVAGEFDEGGYNEKTVIPRIDNIYHALKEVFATAREENILTSEAADRVAEKRLAEGRCP